MERFSPAIRSIGGQAIWRTGSASLDLKQHGPNGRKRRHRRGPVQAMLGDTAKILEKTTTRQPIHGIADCWYKVEVQGEQS